VTRILLVVGPTAAGKTALALALAEAANAEIVSADSQQVYVGMDIGTSKATAAERARVPHHVIDVVRPDEAMTAARWAQLADAAIADIGARGKHAIVCGGTGLYVRALLYGLFDGPPADATLRARLEAEADAAPDGTASLWTRLQAVDPTAAARIDRRDRVRLVRALEVHELTGEPISAHQERHDYKNAPLRYAARGIGLAPPRPELHRRIEVRVDEMLAAGLEAEVRALGAAGYDFGLRAFSAIGYREMCAYLQGKLSLAEVAPTIKSATKRYARRQLSWFRTEPTVSWYESAAAVDAGASIAWLNEPETPTT
jgi:tRNA dimethylallyltransferase